MENEPLVSIIIPVYNAEKYIIETVESILSQDYKNFQLILVNDGSTDKTIDLITQNINDNRVQVENIKNNGVSNARNVGISLVKGEYIMFVDADDYLENNTLASCVEKVKTRDIDILFFSWYKVKQNLKIKVEDLQKHSDQLTANNIHWLRRRCVGPLNEELKSYAPIDLYNTPWAKLYKTSLIKNSGVQFKPRNIVGMEDVLFNIELFQYAKSIDYLPKYLYNYRVDSENSLTKTDVDKLDQKLKNLIKEIRAIDSDDKFKHEALKNRIRFSVINIAVSITSKYRETTFLEKYNRLKKVLNDSFYNHAFQSELSIASGKTWLFVMMAKFRMSLMMVFLLVILNRIK